MDFEKGEELGGEKKGGGESMKLRSEKRGQGNSSQRETFGWKWGEDRL